MFIVMFDDDQGMSVPYALDQEDGGLYGIGPGEPVAIFKSRDDATRAIRISRKLAELGAARGHKAEDICARYDIAEISHDPRCVISRVREARSTT